MFELDIPAADIRDPASMPYPGSVDVGPTEVATNGNGRRFRRVQVPTAGVAGLAAAVPAQVVPTTEVEERLGLEPGWITSRTGVRERRVVAEDETLVDLASEAAEVALERAGIEPDQVDLVLLATFTADDVMPNAAPLVAHRIGARWAGAIDIGSACNGFVSAVDLGVAQIESRRARTVLVIGAEVISRVLNHNDRSTAGLFGDGAGAVVLTTGGPGRIGPAMLGSDGSGAGNIICSHAERQIHMDGRPTFRAAVSTMSKATVEVASRAGLGLDQIDLFVYHQANQRILSAVGERLGLDQEKVLDSVERFGNTSAASIPIALAEAIDAGRLEPGMNVLLAAFGAGFTWGGCLIEWGDV